MSHYRPMRQTIAALAALALTACAPDHQTLVWGKDGATEADMTRDASACNNETRMIAGGNPRINAREVFKDCMISRSWELRDVR